MDFAFSTKLQTTMNNIGTQNGLAAPKSQDPADAILHEYFVAETGRSLFDKRRKKALEQLKGLDTLKQIPKALADATKGMTGSIALISTGNYTATLTTKSPVKSIDPTVLCNELIKLGVDQTTISKALGAATKIAKPAESYTVSVIVS